MVPAVQLMAKKDTSWCQEDPSSLKLRRAKQFTSRKTTSHDSTGEWESMMFNPYALVIPAAACAAAGSSGIQASLNLAPACS
jgi:hypothetical protein